MSVEGSPLPRNGCWNRAPLVEGVTVQSGWSAAKRIVGLLPIVTRYPRMTTIPNPMTKDCQYSKTTADARCDGCKWRQG